MNSELRIFLESEGYSNLIEIPGKGICGLFRFIFTTGLVVGITQFEYVGRYCYSNFHDAKIALNEWNGNGDPSGEWIKYKGPAGDRSRVSEGD